MKIMGMLDPNQGSFRDLPLSRSEDGLSSPMGMGIHNLAQECPMDNSSKGRSSPTEGTRETPTNTTMCVVVFAPAFVQLVSSGTIV